MSEVLKHIDLIDFAPLYMLFAPLGVFACLILMGRIISKFRGIYATVIMFTCLLASIYVFFNIWPEQGVHVVDIPWFNLSGVGEVDLNIHLDAISSLFVLIVLITSFLVHLFSIEYLRGENHFEKYFAYLGLFVFSILGIILAQNLFVVFICWELVGFSSYLLIGFYFKKKEAVFANKKAFIVNRVGDLGFVLALLTIYSSFGTLNIEELLSIFRQGKTSGFDASFMKAYQLTPLSFYLIGGGILSGAVAKSAQFPLNVWLPNAMEGPTPISALIHAATMVAAGVYLIIRTYFLFSPEMLDVVAFIGAITAFMGAFVAMSQRDIKRVLAFSTISQLGYMFMSLGVRSIDGAMFHLMTHAFFKASLFLAAGAVIYSLHKFEYKKHSNFDPQDMFLMGGLRKHMPSVFVGYIVASIALVGLPFTSGFLSKESIIISTINWGMLRGGVFMIVPILGVLGVVMTAFYMGRQVLLVFFGENRLQEKLQITNEDFQIDKAPVLMRLPIAILGTLSLWFVYSLNPFDNTSSWFFEINKTFNVIRTVSFAQVLSEPVGHVSHLMLSFLTVAVALLGLTMAWTKYRKVSSESINKDRKGLIGHNSLIYKLSYNNWYLDQLYDFIFVTPFKLISYFAVFLDKIVIEGILAVLRELTLYLSRVARRIDQNILSRIVDLFALINVIFAAILRFIDRWVVDGLVKLVVLVIGKVGATTKTIQVGNVQGFIVFTILTFVLLLTGMLFILF